MIPIKIQCGCGQRFAFEVEPAAGQLTIPVICPVCGADGTASANEAIARAIAVEPVVPTTLIVPATPAPTSTRLASAPAPEAAASAPAPDQFRSVADAARLGLVSREQAEVEARAKVSWGDSPEKVLAYLMIQGFNHEEASALLEVLFRERKAAVRAKGMKQILMGSGLIIGAAAGCLAMLLAKIIITKLFGVLFLAAMVGLYYLVKGMILVAAPKMESGDVAE